MSDQPSQISRRTLAKGVAWTAPAISIAAAAPSLAASAVEPQDCTFAGNVQVRLEDTATTAGLSDDIWRIDYSAPASEPLPQMTWTITGYEVFSRADDEPGSCPAFDGRDADSASLFTFGTMQCSTLPAENDEQGGGLRTFTQTVTLNPLTPAQRRDADLRDSDWSIFEINWPDRIGSFGRARSRWMTTMELTEVLLPGSSVPCPADAFVDGNPADHLVEARWLRQQANEAKWKFYDAADAQSMSGDTGLGAQNDAMKYLPFGTVPSTYNNTEDI
ncbi:MAG: hypothetical protein ACTMHL_06835 [Janibacter sp.]